MRPALLVVLMGVLSGCPVSAPPPSLTDPGQSNAMALGVLDFTLPKFPDSTPFKLSSERGNVVLLDVWATWCEPCRDSLPLYQDLAKEYGPKGFKVYAINVDADPAQVPKFIAETKLDVNVLLDPSAAYAENTLKVKVMPTALFIDKTGKVRSVHEGFAEEFLAKYVTEIEALLKERSP